MTSPSGDGTSDLIADRRAAQPRESAERHAAAADFRADIAGDVIAPLAPVEIGAERGQQPEAGESDLAAVAREDERAPPTSASTIAALGQPAGGRAEANASIGFASPRL